MTVASCFLSHFQGGTSWDKWFTFLPGLHSPSIGEGNLFHPQLLSNLAPSSFLCFLNYFVKVHSCPPPLKCIITKLTKYSIKPHFSHKPVKSPVASCSHLSFPTMLSSSDTCLLELKCHFVTSVTKWLLYVVLLIVPLGLFGK